MVLETFKRRQRSIIGVAWALAWTVIGVWDARHGQAPALTCFTLAAGWATGGYYVGGISPIDKSVRDVPVSKLHETLRGKLKLRGLALWMERLALLLLGAAAALTIRSLLL